MVRIIMFSPMASRFQMFHLFLGTARNVDIDLLDTIRAMSPGGMPGAVGNRSAARGTEGRRR